jgi:hypothetical protein
MRVLHRSVSYSDEKDSHRYPISAATPDSSRFVSVKPTLPMGNCVYMVQS